MSIEYSLKIKKRKLTIEYIKIIIKELFEKDNIDIKKNNYSTVSMFEELGFKIDLIDKINFPYNIWDSNILNDEFEYNQSLIFSINKQFCDFELLYNNMYKIIFTVMKTINTEALLVSTEEICYFKDNSNVIINKNKYIWENQNNKRLLSDWNVKLIIY